MHNWILEPLVHYALLAAGLGLCLYLFVSLKAEMRSPGAAAPGAGTGSSSGQTGIARQNGAS